MNSGLLIDNILKVEARIAEACKRSGRERHEVTLVAVTKGVQLSRIREAVASGLTVLGENRIQEAEEKIKALKKAARHGESPAATCKWHMIGHLQSNKAPKAVELGFDLIESVDSLKLAQALAKKASERGQAQKALLEINIAQEAQKSGLTPGEALEAFQEMRALEGLKIKGLMCMGPQTASPEEMRPYFRKAKEIWKQMNALDIEADTLSMGMSQDFETAIEEGATIVRIGRAVFGDRAPIHERERWIRRAA